MKYIYEKPQYIVQTQRKCNTRDDSINTTRCTTLDCFFIHHCNCIGFQAPSEYLHSLNRLKINNLLINNRPSILVLK